MYWVRRASAGLLAAGAIDYLGDPGKSPPAELPARASIPPAGRDLTAMAFEPLPGAAEEVNQIRAAFLHADPRGRAEILTGAAATEGAIKAQTAGHPWRCVHLATHGFFESPRSVTAKLHAAKYAGPGAAATFDVSSPGGAEEEAFRLLPFVKSGLALAGAERVLEKKNSNVLSDDLAGDEGLLTAEEVASLDLRRCELVVLSACVTGLGDVVSGEGVLGLDRAFQAAGARSVVASLWRVSDPGTSVLMEEFYKNLLSGKLSRLEALRQAQIAVLRNPQRVLDRAEELKRGPGAKPAPLPDGGRVTPATASSSPDWWAAFVLNGEFR
jgi:CHAT domain-containing protein